MKCPNCETELSIGDLYCSKCGHHVDSGENNTIDSIVENEEATSLSETTPAKGLRGLSRRTIAFISIGAMIVLCVALTGAFLWNTPVHAFEKLYSQKQFGKAQELYTSIEKKGDKDSCNSIKKYLSDNIAEVKSNFINRKINLTQANQFLNDVASFPIVNTEAIGVKTFVNQLDTSHQAYKNGLEQLSKDKYDLAVEELGKVIPDDSNYETSKKKISEVLPKLKEQKLKEAEDLFAKKKYGEAVSAIQVALKYIDNDSELKQKMEFYQGEQNKAKKEFEQRKQQLLSTVTRFQDPVSNKITYFPKPYGDKITFTLGGVIFYPYLRGELGDDSFKLIAGFNRDDWVFMDRIVCNADGYVFELNFNSFDRNTEVEYGAGVDEWVEILAFDRFPSFKSKDLNPNILDDLKKLANANLALIKFEGDTKSFDYVLAPYQKNTINNILELHNMNNGIK